MLTTARHDRSLAIAILAASVAIGVGLGPVAAKTINCPFASECAGGKKADTFNGEGQSNLFGNGGNDKITDSGGASVIKGGKGKNVIQALKDFNIIEGGAGNDVILAKNSEPDDINRGGGKDRVTFDAGMDTFEQCKDQRT